MGWWVVLWHRGDKGAVACGGGRRIVRCFLPAIIELLNVVSLSFVLRFAAFVTITSLASEASIRLSMVDATSTN
jgi:hypothetical protein